MGEVYRARDTRLDRIVATKILPEAFAYDADRLVRFPATSPAYVLGYHFRKGCRPANPPPLEGLGESHLEKLAQLRRRPKLWDRLKRFKR